MQAIRAGVEAHIDVRFVGQLSRQTEEESLANEMAADQAWLDQLSEEAERELVARRERERR